MESQPFHPMHTHEFVPPDIRRHKRIKIQSLDMKLSYMRASFHFRSSFLKRDCLSANTISIVFMHVHQHSKSERRLQR